MGRLTFLAVLATAMIFWQNVASRKSPRRTAVGAPKRAIDPEWLELRQELIDCVRGLGEEEEEEEIRAVRAKRAATADEAEFPTTVAGLDRLVKKECLDTCLNPSFFGSYAQTAKARPKRSPKKSKHKKGNDSEKSGSEESGSKKGGSKDSSGEEGRGKHRGDHDEDVRSQARVLDRKGSHGGHEGPSKGRSDKNSDSQSKESEESKESEGSKERKESRKRDHAKESRSKGKGDKKSSGSHDKKHKGNKHIREDRDKGHHREGKGHRSKGSKESHEKKRGTQVVEVFEHITHQSKKPFDQTKEWSVANEGREVVEVAQQTIRKKPFKISERPDRKDVRNTVIREHRHIKVSVASAESDYEVYGLQEKEKETQEGEGGEEEDEEESEDTTSDAAAVIASEEKEEQEEADKDSVQEHFCVSQIERTISNEQRRSRAGRRSRKKKAKLTTRRALRKLKLRLFRHLRVPHVDFQCGVKPYNPKNELSKLYKRSIRTADKKSTTCGHVEPINCVGDLFEEYVVQNRPDDFECLSPAQVFFRQKTCRARKCHCKAKIAHKVRAYRKKKCMENYKKEYFQWFGHKTFLSTFTSLHKEMGCDSTCSAENVKKGIEAAVKSFMKYEAERYCSRPFRFHGCARNLLGRGKKKAKKALKQRTPKKERSRTRKTGKGDAKGGKKNGTRAAKKAARKQAKKAKKAKKGGKKGRGRRGRN